MAGRGRPKKQKNRDNQSKETESTTNSEETVDNEVIETSEELETKPEVKQEEMEETVEKAEIKDTDTVEVVEKDKKEEKPEPTILQNKVVKIQPIYREDDWVPVGHEANGPATGSKREFIAPQDSISGRIKNILNEEETKFFEDRSKSHLHGFTFEPGDLAPNKRKDNVWETEIGEFSLLLHGKDPKILDLSKGEDYILYKIALANTNIIAPDIDAGTPGNPRHKQSYKYMIVSPDDEDKKKAAKVYNKSKAWMEFGKISEDRQKLRAALEISAYVKKGSISNRTKLELLQPKVDEFIETDMEKFMSVVKDELFEKKAFILDASDEGYIQVKGTTYYMNNGEDEIGSSLTEAAAFLNNPKNQPAYIELQKQLNASK